MAKKLKCWKKVYSGEFSLGFSNIKKSNHLQIVNEKKVFPITGYDGWVVNNVKPPTKNRGSQTNTLNKFKSKPQALKFAKSYMRKHDRC